MKGEQFWLPGLKPEEKSTAPKNEYHIGDEEDYMDPANFADNKNSTIKEKPQKPIEKTIITEVPLSNNDDDNKSDVAAIVADRRFKGTRYPRPNQKTIPGSEKRIA